MVHLFCDIMMHRMFMVYGLTKKGNKKKGLTCRSLKLCTF